MRRLTWDSKSIGCWGLLTFTMVFVITITIVGCGNPRSPDHQPDRTAAPQAASGESMVYGTILIVPGHCQNGTLVNLIVQTLANNVVFSSQLPSTSAYQAQLSPGEYVLTATAPTCIFSRNFQVAADESLPIDVILQ